MTSVEVMQAFIARTKEINTLLNCVIDSRYDDALKEAAEADDLIASGKFSLEELAEQKPFLGVPISTKDNIAVKGLLLSAGLWSRREVRAKEDSDAMALMRKAGAIPFALTNVPELCMWWESFNTIFGKTNNPYDTNRIVGGSSGGEGVIQAAGGSPFGLGSDIGGSIRMPAFFNGVFGHKPSKNVVSNDKCFPAATSEEQNTFLGIGPMCKYATDLKPVLKVIAGEKAKLLNLDEPVDAKKIRYFYQPNDGGALMVSPVDNDQEVAVAKVIEHLKKFTTPTETKLAALKESYGIWFANMKDDSGIGFDHQFANYQGHMKPWTELWKWFLGKSEHTIVAIIMVIMDKFEVAYGTPEYHKMVEKRNQLRDEISELLGDNGVLIYPTHPTCALYHYETVFRPYNFSYTAIFNVLGFPATNVPLGLGAQQGLPTGIQVVANVNQDRLCLAVAEELEKAFGGWTPPKSN